MDFFQNHLTEPYPLAHLQVVLSVNFAAGAMENFGLIVSRGEYMVVDAQSDADTQRRVSYVISHEIAHQWFGNVVTNADWSDLYVQEGLATFLGYRCVDTVYPALQGSLHFRMGDVTAYYAYDVFNYSTPIKPQGLSGLEAVNSFSPVSYTKVRVERRNHQQSALILEAVEESLNAAAPDAMWAMLNAFVSRYRYACYSSAQFEQAVVEAARVAQGEVAAKKMERFLQSWIRQPGLPVVRAVRSRGKLVLVQVGSMRACEA